MAAEPKEIVRNLLVFDCHSSPTARNFFESHLGDEALLHTLLNMAIDDYSGDAQRTAAYRVSLQPSDLLASDVEELRRIAANEWNSVAGHARRALLKLE